MQMAGRRNDRRRVLKVLYESESVTAGGEDGSTRNTLSNRTSTIDLDSFIVNEPNAKYVYITFWFDIEQARAIQLQHTQATQGSPPQLAWFSDADYNSLLESLRLNWDSKCPVYLCVKQGTGDEYYRRTDANSGAPVKQVIEVAVYDNEGLMNPEDIVAVFKTVAKQWGYTFWIKPVRKEIYSSFTFDEKLLSKL